MQKRNNSPTFLSQLNFAALGLQLVSFRSRFHCKLEPDILLCVIAKEVSLSALLEFDLETCDVNLTNSIGLRCIVFLALH